MRIGVPPKKNWPKHSRTKSNRLSSIRRVKVKKNRFSDEKIIQVIPQSTVNEELMEVVVRCRHAEDAAVP